MEKIQDEVENIDGIIADKVLYAATASFKERGQFVLAVSGGKSPTELFKKIALNLNSMKELKMTVFLVDERFVPADSEDSNTKLVCENLISNLKDTFDIEFIKADTTVSIEECVRGYANAIDNIINESQIDLSILGVGTDGHIASLFELPSIPLEDDSVISVKREDFERISLTYSSLLSIEEILVYAPNESKKEIVDQITEESDLLRFPVEFILKNHPCVELYHSH